MLSKEDRILRLKIEAIGIVVIILMLGLLIIFKGNVNNNDENIYNDTQVNESASADDLIDKAQISQPVDGEGEPGVIEEIDNSETDMGTSGETVVIEYADLNADLAQQDAVAYDMVSQFLNLSGLDIDFNPSYSIAEELRMNESNILIYNYTYRADDNVSKGNYSNLNVEVIKNIDQEIQKATFSIGVHDDMQTVSTVRAKMSEAFSTIYGADLYELSTMDKEIEFDYNDTKYKIGLTTALSYQDDYILLYYNVEKVDYHETTYSEHMEDVNNRFNLENITKTKKLNISDDTFTDDMQTLLNMEDTTCILNEAYVYKSGEKDTEKAIFTLDDATLEVASTLDKRNSAPSYIVKLTNTGKDKAELQELGKKIAKEIFDVKVSGKYKTDTENDILSLVNSTVAVRISGDNLEVATAKSDYDFNKHLEDQINLEDIVEPEIVDDPDTMETTYVYPDIQGEPEPEATN